MNKFNTGEVVYVKATDEAVTVMATRKLAPGDKRFPIDYEGSGQIVVVQRPVISEDGGLRYEFYDFLAEALETPTEQTNRRIQRFRENKELYKQAQVGDDDGGPVILQ